MQKRARPFDQPRELRIDLNVNRYAEGSCMIYTGNTQVLCTASIDESVPSWLKGKGKGWVTAEYSMLPRSTHTRMKRDREKVSGRTQEIQRLIGRALRSVVDLEKIGETQIIVDCDVIQADGGTRTASITGGYVALGLAIQKMLANGKAKDGALMDTVQAISVGLSDGNVLVDLDYEEDSTCDVDMNFVRTGSGLYVEVQGTAEKKPFSASDLQSMMTDANRALDQLREVQKIKLGL